MGRVSHSIRRVLSDLFGDLRFAGRMLRKNRGTTAVAVISLAIAIGPNIALFSVVQKLLLSQSPVPDIEHLFYLSLQTDKPGVTAFPSYPDLLDFQAEAGNVASFAGYSNGGALLNRGGQWQRVSEWEVTGNYFSVLGARADVGRTLRESDADLGGEPPVVLGYSFWQREYGGAADVLGKTLVLSGRGYTVVGVMRRGFGGGLVPTDVWIPFPVIPEAARRRGVPIGVLVRLRDGVSAAHAEAVLTTVAKRLASRHPVMDNWKAAVLIPASENGRTGVLGEIILWLAGLVVLVACANITGILLAQGEARTHEFSMRAAMGASRGRLIRQLVAESLLLSLLGASAGLLFAYWVIPAVSAIQPIPIITLHYDFHIGGPVLAYALGLTLLSALAAGLLPALRFSQTDLVSGLKGASSGTSPRSRFRGGLVIAQIAVSQFLLVGASLLVLSYWQGRNMRPGFNPAKKVLVALLTSTSRDKPVDFKQLADKLRALPGVRQVCLADRLPLLGAGLSGSRVSVPGGRLPPEQIATQNVSPHYFAIMGTPLLRGRGFRSVDSAQTAVVNETMATQFWGNADAAVGKVVRVNGADRRIVGVAVNGKYASLRERPTPFLFLGMPLPERAGGGMLLVETAVPPAAMAGIVRKTIHDVAPDTYIAGVATLRQSMRVALLPQITAAGFTGALALLGIFLAGVGLFGLVAYSVGRRTREIGIRVALGAGKADIVSLVLREAFLRVSIGVVIGLALALAAAQLVTSLLYHVSPADPAALAGAVAIVVSVGLLAAYVPVRRALRVDPMTTLRSE